MTLTKGIGQLPKAVLRLTQGSILSGTPDQQSLAEYQDFAQSLYIALQEDPWLYPTIQLSYIKAASDPDPDIPIILFQGIITQVSKVLGSTAQGTRALFDVKCVHSALRLDVSPFGNGYYYYPGKPLIAPSIGTTTKSPSQGSSQTSSVSTGLAEHTIGSLGARVHLFNATQSITDPDYSSPIPLSDILSAAKGKNIVQYLDAVYDRVSRWMTQGRALPDVARVGTYITCNLTVSGNNSTLRDHILTQCVTAAIGSSILAGITQVTSDMYSGLQLIPVSIYQNYLGIQKISHMKLCQSNLWYMPQGQDSICIKADKLGSCTLDYDADMLASSPDIVFMHFGRNSPTYIQKGQQYSPATEFGKFIINKKRVEQAKSDPQILLRVKHLVAPIWLAMHITRNVDRDDNDVLTKRLNDYTQTICASIYLRQKTMGISGPVQPRAQALLDRYIGQRIQVQYPTVYAAGVYTARPYTGVLSSIVFTYDASRQPSSFTYMAQLIAVTTKDTTISMRNTLYEYVTNQQATGLSI